MDNPMATMQRMVPKIQTLEKQPEVTKEMLGQTLKDSVEFNKTDIQATLTERSSRYGDFSGHAEITQTLKHNFFRFMERVNPTQRLTNAEHEAIDMIFHKLGRIANGDPHYKDSWVDIAGYATLVAGTLKD